MYLNLYICIFFFFFQGCRACGSWESRKCREQKFLRLPDSSAEVWKCLCCVGWHKSVVLLQLITSWLTIGCNAWEYIVGHLNRAFISCGHLFLTLKVTFLMSQHKMIKNNLCKLSDFVCASFSAELNLCWSQQVKPFFFSNNFPFTFFKPVTTATRFHPVLYNRHYSSVAPFRPVSSPPTSLSVTLLWTFLPLCSWFRRSVGSVHLSRLNDSVCLSHEAGLLQPSII